MKRRHVGYWIIAAFVMIVVMAILFFWQQGHRTDRTHDVPEDCASIITVAPNGHRMLNTKLATKENAHEVNRCIDAIDIKNVRIVRNLSVFPGYVLADNVHLRNHT